MDWFKFWQGVCAVVFVAALLGASASALAGPCSGLFTRSDGAYPAMAFGETVAAREAALDQWCAAPCVIAGANHTPSSFDYSYDAGGGNAGGPFRFNDIAGADCTSAAFDAEAGGGGGSAGPALPPGGVAVAPTGYGASVPLVPPQWYAAAVALVAAACLLVLFR